MMESSGLFEINVDGMMNLEEDDAMFSDALFNGSDTTSIVQFNNIEERPIPVKAEVVPTTKLQLQGLTVNHNLPSNLTNDGLAQFTQPREPPNMKLELEPLQPGYVLYTVDAENIGLDETIDIQPQKSTKNKNTPYLLKDDGTITTKNMTSVTFIATPKHGKIIRATMRYTETPNENKPVNACKMHRDCDICTINMRQHPVDFNFCIDQAQKFNCHYSYPGGHPTAEFAINDGLVDEQGNLRFNIIFTCLNSCEIHRKYGKKLQLTLSVCDGDYNQLMEKHFAVRVCKNVKRDHKEEEELPRECKKKRKVSKDENMSPQKQMKIEDTPVPVTQVCDSQVPVMQEVEAPQWNCFLMKSMKHQELVVSLIKELQGDTFPFDDPDMHMDPTALL